MSLELPAANVIGPVLMSKYPCQHSLRSFVYIVISNKIILAFWLVLPYNINIPTLFLDSLTSASIDNYKGGRGESARGQVWHFLSVFLNANLDNKKVCSWAKNMQRVGTVLSILQTGMRRRTKEENANYNDIVKLSEKWTMTHLPTPLKGIGKYIKNI